MESSAPRIPATGTWTAVIGPGFDTRDNGDSVQAVHGGRIVYFSSMRVALPGVHLPAEKLRAVAAARLGAGERLSHIGQSVQGDAQIQPNGHAWRLLGAMCADGTMVTCVIDFPSPNEQPWAISVWRSLNCDAKAA